MDSEGYIIKLAKHTPAVNLHYEERLYTELKQNPRPVCLFYTNDRSIVVGRTNRLEDWVFVESIQEDGIPLIRRFSGGGAVYHDLNCLNYSFMLPKSMLEGLLHRKASDALNPSLYIGFFRRLVIQALQRCGDGFTETGISDISLHGLKISGNAQRLSLHLVLHHGTVLLRCPLEAYERYLRIPPNRPGILHAGFVSGLHELGCAVDGEQIAVWIAEEFARVCSIRLHEGNPESA